MFWRSEFKCNQVKGAVLSIIKRLIVSTTLCLSYTFWENPNSFIQTAKIPNRVHALIPFTLVLSEKGLFSYAIAMQIQVLTSWLSSSNPRLASWLSSTRSFCFMLFKIPDASLWITARHVWQTRLITARSDMGNFFIIMNNISEGRWCQDIGFEQVVWPSPTSLSSSPSGLPMFSVKKEEFKDPSVMER